MDYALLKELRGLFPILIVIGIILFAFYMIKRSRKQHEQKLESIAMSLGGECVSGFWEIKLMNYEKEQRIVLLPGGKNTDQLLELQQFTDLDFDLSIMKENKATLAVEGLGLNIAMKIGDPIFDEKYLVRSRAKEQAQMFLSSAERRAIIDFFFDAGFTMMTLQQKKLSFAKPDYTDQDLDPNLLRSQLDKLHKFIMG